MKSNPSVEVGTRTFQLTIRFVFVETKKRCKIQCTMMMISHIIAKIPSSILPYEMFNLIVVGAGSEDVAS